MPPAAAAAAASVAAETWHDLLVRPAIDNGHVVLACFLLFFVVERLSHVVSDRFVPAYRRLSPKLQTDWNVRVTATFHSLVVWAVVPSFFWPEEGLAEDPYFYSAFHQAFYSFSTGYFLYDLCVCVWHGWGFAFILHGAACVPVFFFALYPFLHYWGSYFLGMFEMSTVPLHVRALLEMAGLQDSLLFQIASLWFFLAFTVCRILGGYYVNYLWWSEMIALIQAGGAHSLFVIGYYMLANGILLGLSTYWWIGMLRVAFCDRASAQKLGRERKSSDADKEL